MFDRSLLVTITIPKPYADEELEELIRGFLTTSDFGHWRETDAAQQEARCRFVRGNWKRTIFGNSLQPERRAFLPWDGCYPMAFRADVWVRSSPVDAFVKVKLTALVPDTKNLTFQQRIMVFLQPSLHEEIRKRHLEAGEDIEKRFRKEAKALADYLTKCVQLSEPVKMECEWGYD